MHYPAFLVELAARERHLSDYVQREFEDYLACGCLAHGFLRVRCNDCHAEVIFLFKCRDESSGIIFRNFRRVTVRDSVGQARRMCQ